MIDYHFSLRGETLNSVLDKLREHNRILSEALGEPHYIDCPECNGDGENKVLLAGHWAIHKSDTVTFETCRRCDGEGRIDENE